MEEIEEGKVTQMVKEEGDEGARAAEGVGDMLKR